MHKPDSLFNILGDSQSKAEMSCFPEKFIYRLQNSDSGLSIYNQSMRIKGLVDCAVWEHYRNILGLRAESNLNQSRRRDHLFCPKDLKALHITISHSPCHMHIHTLMVVSNMVATATRSTGAMHQCHRALWLPPAAGKAGEMSYPRVRLKLAVCGFEMIIQRLQDKLLPREPLSSQKISS